MVDPSILGGLLPNRGGKIITNNKTIYPPPHITTTACTTPTVAPVSQGIDVCKCQENHQQEDLIFLSFFICKRHYSIGLIWVNLWWAILSHTRTTGFFSRKLIVVRRSGSQDSYRYSRQERSFLEFGTIHWQKLTIILTSNGSPSTSLPSGKSSTTESGSSEKIAVREYPFFQRDDSDETTPKSSSGMTSGWFDLLGHKNQVHNLQWIYRSFSTGSKPLTFQTQIPWSFEDMTKKYLFITWPTFSLHMLMFLEKVINGFTDRNSQGRVIVYRGAPHLVLEMLHRTQGRQAGFVQTTLRNLQSGSTTTTKFRSTDNVDFMHTTTQKLEYSYKDAEGHHFMDLETFEDTVLQEDMIGDDEIFLVEGNSYDILLVDGEAVRLELPASVEVKVVRLLTPFAVIRRECIKPVTISSGISVQVPLFIKQDEIIKISTSDKSYLGRADKK